MSFRAGLIRGDRVSAAAGSSVVGAEYISAAAGSSVVVGAEYLQQLEALWSGRLL